MQNGWITLHRKIRDHWIFEDPERLKAWVTILLEVNHSPKKVLIKNSLIEVERGESLNSLDTWRGLFGKNWSKSKVRRFFNLLESDSMIALKPTQKTTHLRVCNYDTYQSERTITEPQVKRKRNASEPQVALNNNTNKVNNDKKVYRKVQHLSLSTDDFNKLLKKYTKEQIDDILDDMENWAKLKSKKSAYLTANKWLKSRAVEYQPTERALPRELQ